MTRQSVRRVGAGLGLAALLSAGTLTACGGGGSNGPSSTTTTTTTTSTTVPSPTEKSLSPNGGNSFSPSVKAPPAPTAIPGTHN